MNNEPIVDTEDCFITDEWGNDRKPDPGLLLVRRILAKENGWPEEMGNIFSLKTVVNFLTENGFPYPFNEEQEVELKLRFL